MFNDSVAVQRHQRFDVPVSLHQPKVQRLVPQVLGHVGARQAESEQINVVSVALVQSRPQQDRCQSFHSVAVILFRVRTRVRDRSDSEQEPQNFEDLHGRLLRLREIHDPDDERSQAYHVVSERQTFSASIR